MRTGKPGLSKCGETLEVMIVQTSKAMMEGVWTHTWMPKGAASERNGRRNRRRSVCRPYLEWKMFRKVEFNMLVDSKILQ
jgi:hypothetical protein